MRVLKILKTLIKFDTDSEKGTQFLDCAEYLKELLEKICDRVRLLGNKNRPNIYAELNTNSKITLGFCCHYDVVPPGNGWSTNPWKLTVKENKAYGRGVADDKGNIASLISALKQVEQSNYNIKVIITPDEETGGRIGLEYLLKKHLNTIKANCYYVLDSSPEYISIGCSGILSGRIIIKGKGGHAGYDFLCDNPVWKLNEVFTILKKYRKIREQKNSRLKAYKGPKHHVHGRFNVTMIRAGYKFNMIPNDVELMFDMRLLPEEKVVSVKKEFKKYLKENLKCGYALELSNGVEGYYLKPKDIKYAELLNQAVFKTTGKKLGFYGEFGRTDGSYFAKFNIPSIGYGLLRREYNIHAPNEFIYIDDLKMLKNVLIRLLEK
jgi:succinyl-diaminopimelate desuccinylase